MMTPQRRKLMSGINKVFLIGHLGADPEVRYTTNGKALARLSLATSENWSDKDGQKQERTEWHRIVVWGKLGELCGEYLRKGRQVFIEGRIQTRSWDDKDGQKKYTTEVVAQNVQFLGGAKESGKSLAAEQPTNGESVEAPAISQTSSEAFGATDDDIPF